MPIEQVVFPPEDIRVSFWDRAARSRESACTGLVINSSVNQMINLLESLRKPIRPWSARTPLAKAMIGIIALAIPLALAGTYMLNGGSKFQDFLPGRSAFSAGAAAGARSGFASRLSAVGSNLLGALGLRSPGERSQGQLADAKGGSARQRSYSPRHHERALAKVRPPKSVVNQPFPAVADNAVSSSAVTNALTPGSQDGVPGGGEQLVTGNNPGFGGGPGGGFIFPGTGGGGVVVAPPPPPVPPITSAVPEPSTWAMMLVGFWGIGASLRSRRRRARPQIGAIKATVATS